SAGGFSYEELFIGEGGRFLKNAVVYSDLADVVQQRAHTERLKLLFRQMHALSDRDRYPRHSLGMASCVFVFSVDGGGQGLYGSNEQLAVFLSGTCELGDVFFELVAHCIEGLAESADLGNISCLDPE